MLNLFEIGYVAVPMTMSPTAALHSEPDYDSCVSRVGTLEEHPLADNRLEAAYR